MKTQIQHLNPEGLHKNPAFSQVITVEGPTKTIYIGGQNAVDASGKIVGKDDIKTQTEQAFSNLELALAAAGGKLENIVKWSLFVRSDQNLQPGFEVFQKVWGRRGAPPVITSAFVEGLANPDFLVEIEAIAVVPL